MTSKYTERLSRIERKLDELTKLVYEIRGELNGYKKYTTFMAGIVSIIISGILNLMGVRR